MTPEWGFNVMQAVGKLLQAAEDYLQAAGNYLQADEKNFQAAGERCTVPCSIFRLFLNNQLELFCRFFLRLFVYIQSPFARNKSMTHNNSSQYDSIMNHKVWRHTFPSEPAQYLKTFSPPPFIERNFCANETNTWSNRGHEYWIMSHNLWLIRWLISYLSSEMKTYWNNDIWP